MSYEDLNLDPFLQSNNPFKDREKIFVNPYNFDVINDRNIIGATKLRDFSFNSGTGGTITLGGVNDQNGVLIVRDSSGGTVATITNTGITVTNGNITIQNAGGTTILDSTGLVSSANFLSASTVAPANGTTTSTSYTDAPNLTMDIVTDKTTNVLLLSSVNALSFGDPTDSTSRWANFRMNLGGTDVGVPIVATGAAFGSASGYTVIFNTYEAHAIETISPGTTTFKMRFRTTNSSYSARYESGSRLSYVILGS